MNRKIWINILAIGVVTAGAAILAGWEEQQPAEQPQELLAEVDYPLTSEQTPTEVSAADCYVIQEYEGHVAVFEAQDLAHPRMVLDTLVRYLPEYDQAQLTQGIAVEGDSQLAARIEDFVS